jgi:uncharacterized protein YktB (UPF0637 family)
MNRVDELRLIVEMLESKINTLNTGIEKAQELRANIPEFFPDDSVYDDVMFAYDAFKASLDRIVEVQKAELQIRISQLEEKDLELDAEWKREQQGDNVEPAEPEGDEDGADQSHGQRRSE